IISMGGFDHIVVKVGPTMEAYVIGISSLEFKLDAKKFIVVKDEKQTKKIKNSFDVIINTVSIA
ncbi:unnamed protein product, partial [Rotaria sp. Silwood2]